MKYDVPFVSNSPDNLHCAQAASLMILKYFKPDTTIGWEEWSRLTGYEEGKGTWASAALLWFAKNGFEVKHYELFDYEAFFKDGGEYLVRLTGQEVGEWQVAHSNIPLEQARAKQLMKKGLVEQREPTITDITNFLDNGYLVKALVNSRKLNGEKGYFGHIVTIIGYDENSLYLNDPGLPAVPGRRISFEHFESAWADPNRESKELDAIKLR